MIIEKVEKADYESVIRSSWEKDDELLNKWHIRAGEGLDVCVDDTLNVLNNQTDKTTFHLYKVRNGNQDIGFFGSEIYNEKPFLTTFFISPEHRTIDVKDSFIKLVCETIGNDFDTALYVVNSKAISWFVRMGANVKGLYDSEKGDVVMLNLKL